MKKLIPALILLLAATFAPKGVIANEVEHCTEVYGGGVVCGAKTHTPVNTGIADNPAYIAGAFLIASGVLYFLSKKIKVSTSKIK
jgi:LPXTG-motif cell wall-anchored protein